MATPEYLGHGNDDGTIMGRSATDLIGFYGIGTAIARPAAAGQAQITDGSTGAAAATNGIAALTGTYNSTLLINAIATLAAGINAANATLTSLNLQKGSA